MPTETTESRHLLAIAVSATGGALLSVQGRMNGELSARLGEPMEAALWSFLSGLVVLTGLLLWRAPLRAGLRSLRDDLRSGSIKWWQCTGGLIGGLYVAAQTYAVPLLGVALFTVAVVAGQTGNGLVADRFGLGPGAAVSIHPGRILAALLAVIGVAVAVSGRSGGHTLVVLPVILALLVGGGLAVQAGFNGRVNRATAQPLSTTWLNFILGTGMLLVVTAIKALSGGLHLSWPHGIPAWAWLGGLCGIVAVASTAWSVKHLGILVQGLAVLTGQLSVAVLLDLFNPTTRGNVGGAVILGTAVTFVAAGLGAWLARRASRRPAGHPNERIRT